MTKFEEVLKGFQEADPNGILEAIREMEQISIDAGRAAKEAEKEYYADAAQSKAKVTARIEALIKQRDACQAKIAAFKKPLASATVRGDGKKLAAIKADMKELEADKTQISTELEMLQSTHIAGDVDLYTRVIQENQRTSELREQYRTAKKKVYQFALDMLEAYQAIKQATSNYDLGGGIGADLDKLDKHFNHEKYAEIAAQSAAEEAARNAARASGHRVHVMAPRSIYTDPEYVPAGRPGDVTMVETPKGTRFVYGNSQKTAER